LPTHDPTPIPRSRFPPFSTARGKRKRETPHNFWLTREGLLPLRFVSPPCGDLKTGGAGPQEKRKKTCSRAVGLVGKGGRLRSRWATGGQAPPTAIHVHRGLRVPVHGLSTGVAPPYPSNPQASGPGPSVFHFYYYITRPQRSHTHRPVLPLPDHPHTMRLILPVPSITSHIIPSIIVTTLIRRLWRKFQQVLSLPEKDRYGFGMKYLLGQGTEKDETLAVKWFQKAAAKGHVYAQFHLAEAFHYGRGVAQDKDEALKWYLEADKNGPEGLVPASLIDSLYEELEKSDKQGEKKAGE